jgi:hypothetical protein
MSGEKNTAATLSGQGQLDASGLPIHINVNSFTNSASSSVEMDGLYNTTPFLQLCEVYDPIFTKVWWHQIG